MKVKLKVIVYHVTNVTKHVIPVVPEAVETQHVAVVIEELFVCVHRIVRTQWLECFLNLNTNTPNIY